MSVKIQKKNLLDAMQKAFPVVPSKSSLLILSNFKLSYANSILEIVATDADHSLLVSAAAEGDEPFDITVNARKIFEIVRELPEGEVTLSTDRMVLILETEKGFSCKMAGADSSDFPGIPTIDGGVELSISSSSLTYMINKSAFAASKDESRASLCGILWELFPEKIGMVATDGHRLGHSFMEMNLPVKEHISKIISQKGVSTLQRITDPKNEEEELKVLIGDKYISFSTPTFTMVSKIIEGMYPDYGKVIPKNNSKVIVADRVQMLEAVRRVSVLSNQKNNLIKLIFKSGTMEAVVMNREIGGEARESMDIDYNGDEHVMGFNGKYLNEILNILETEKVKLEVETQIGACLIHPEYGEKEEKVADDLFLLMPLRIVDDI